MRKTISILLATMVLASMGLAQKMQPDREASLRSIVEAERAFASASVAKGTRAAFIENLSDDSILFRPRAVAGKKWMEEHPARPGLLTWRPIFADVSNAGDMGYTTGPWEFREKSLEDRPIAYGHFLTVWKRQADGQWKAVIDLGISHPQPATQTTDVAFTAQSKNGKTFKLMAGADALRAELLKTEEEFSKFVASKGKTDALLTHFASDVRLYRMNAFPAVGRKAAITMLSGKSGVLSWQPAYADVSVSGDLGYTYGAYEFAAPAEKTIESGNYVRIWKRQAGGKWKVVADVLNPVPAAPAS